LVWSSSRWGCEVIHEAVLEALTKVSKAAVAADGKSLGEILLTVESPPIPQSTDSSSHHDSSSSSALSTADYKYTFASALISAGYNITWVTTSRYPDRINLETLTLNGIAYPSINKIDSNYRWYIVSSLDENAILYKNSLGELIYPDNTYYLWYGNDSAARGCYNGQCNWLFPTKQNATYFVKVIVTQKVQDASSNLQVTITSNPTFTSTDFKQHSTETTTVPPAGVNTGDSHAFPIMFILIGIGGFVIAAICVMLVRRWWIHRQNPALFRKYD